MTGSQAIGGVRQLPQKVSSAYQVLTLQLLLASAVNDILSMAFLWPWFDLFLERLPGGTKH